MKGIKMNIKTIPIDDLKPYAHNPKQNPTEQIEKIAKNITEFGFLVPILIDADNNIIAGHGRLMAARKLGLVEAPTIRVDHLTEAQIQAYRIADNKLTMDGGWDLELLELEIGILQDMDFDIDLTGFDDIEIGELFPSDPEPENFDAEAAMDEESAPLVQTGELWILGDHRLLCADSTKSDDVERLMDGEKMDMMLTDPPYGVDYQDLKKNFDKILNDKEEDIPKILKSIARYGNIPYYICCNWQSYPLFFYILKDIIDIKAVIIWDKKRGVQNLDKYYKRHEFIIYSGVFGGEKTIDGDVWELNRETSDVHPTMKPIELCSRAINNSSKPDESVLDLFGGSGSTLIACEQLSRKCYMMELDSHYCSVILDRWANYTKEDPIREDGMVWSELKSSQV